MGTTESNRYYRTSLTIGNTTYKINSFSTTTYVICKGINKGQPSRTK